MRPSKVPSRRNHSLRLLGALGTTAVAVLSGPIQAAEVSWDGGAADNLWTSSLNWAGDVQPLSADDLVFGTGPVGAIRLNGDQSVNSLAFNESFTLGVLGSQNILTNTTGNISVGAGDFVAIHNILAGANGLNVSGGGSLYLTNPFNSFLGNTTVAGTGTSLWINPAGTTIPTSRIDATVLGGTNPRIVTLQGGGELRVIGTSYNPDGGSKNFVLGTGGGAFNVASGFQQMTIDDAGQIVVAAAATGVSLIKNGNGRLTLTSTDYNLASNLTVNGGVLEFGRLQGGGGTGTRFSSFAATGSITVNSGLLVPNSGTRGTIDQNLTLNGGALGVQGQDHNYGGNEVANVAATTKLTLNGGALLSREAFNPQGGRFLRMNGDMEGSGTVNIYGATGAGANARIVFQNGAATNTFSGTFVINDNTTLESNPRSGTTQNVGKTFGNATIELKGYNSGLDVRDNGAGSNGLLNAGESDYSANSINITSMQAGGVQRLAVDRASANTGNTFVFNNLTIGNHRLQVTGGNGYGVRFNNLVLTGSPTLDIASAPVQVQGAINESAAGQSITKLGNSALTLAGATSISNLDVRHGAVVLNGAGSINPGNLSGTGSITINGAAPATGAEAAYAAGLLHLDNSVSTNSNRLHNSVGVTLRSNSTLRLTSQSGTAVNEVTGPVTVPFGNPTFDVVRSGTAAPAVLTLTNVLTNRGANAVLNFTGSSLGTTGDTARIVIPGQATTSFLGGWAVSGNEFAKYDSTVDGASALGVTSFAAGDYTPIASDLGLKAAASLVGDPALHGKIVANAAATAPVTLSANAFATTLNLQPTTTAGSSTANINTNGFLLTLEGGGLMSSGQTATIIGGATGGITSGTNKLFITNNANLNINAVIQDNAAGAVTLVKSGTGSLNLINQGALSGTGGHTNTFTGGVVVNAGVLNVSRGTYLGTGPITLAGGQLEINQPAPNAVTNSNLTGFGQNLIIEGNSMLGFDDNGNNYGGQELADTSSGDNNTVPLGSLSINGAHTFTMGSYSYDVSFTSASFTDTPTFNLTPRRDANFSAVIQGAVTGSGFNVLGTVVAGQGNPGSIVLGGGASDTAANTLSGPITIYGGTVRLDKANGVNAITDGAGEDVIINGGTLAWGPGHFLTTTGNVGARMDGTALSGGDNIPDTATITMLNGNLGINNQFNNEKFGTLIQKNGTLNPGVGTMEIGTATISGGAVNFNSGGTLKTGTLSLESGAPDLNVSNNLTASKSVLEIGSGGLTITGQNINLGASPSSNAGGGATIKLGGNVTVNDDPLNASSYDSGIFVQGGRELADNSLDLMGSVRTFTIDPDVVYTIAAAIENGGLNISGGGQIILNNAPSRPSTFAGPVTVDQGVLVVRSATGLGSAVAGTTVNSGGTLKIDGGRTFADVITLSGAGAFVPGTTVREQGALVSESGTNRLTGGVVLATDATIASNAYQIPMGGLTQPFSYSNLIVTAGVTGAGTLTLGGNGDGSLLAGVNTTSGGLEKIGGGRWTIAGASTYTGETRVGAGILAIENGNALGSVAAGTTVYGGAALQLAGDITVGAEALTLNGFGIGSTQTGALENVRGANTSNGAISLGSNSTVRVSSGSTLTLGGDISGTGRALTLLSEGNTNVSGAISTGAGTLIKRGAGTVTLAGANTFTGATNVEGGELALSFVSNNGGKLSSTAPVNFSGGSLSMAGNASAPSTQTVNGVNLLSGNAAVLVAGNGVQTATLNVGAITRTPGATASFTLGANGSISTTASNTDGILGSYATVNGTDWATVTAGKIGALSTYTPLSPTADAGTGNAQIGANQTQAGAVTANSLKISGGTALLLGTNILTLNSGGLLHTGASNFGIAGTGLIAGATNESELIVHTAGGVLDIAAPLIGGGSGGLTKAGSGTLVLSSASTFTGDVNINDGTLAIVGGGDAPALGSNPATGKNVVVNGGTFSVLSGSYDPGANTKKIVIGSAGGALDVFNGTLLLNDANQLSGAGTLTKTGAGRLTLGQASVGYTGFTGNVVVNGGILDLVNTTAVGGRADQSITVNPGAILINRAGTLANNLVINGGVLAAAGGDRTFTGTLELNGTNRVLLLELDAVQQARSITLSNRITGGGTIDVFGTNNGNALFLSSGSNEIGTINLNTNATVEARGAGSLSNGATLTQVNLNGNNARFLLRSNMDANFQSNVTVNSISQAELGVDRPGGTASALGTNEFLTINNLTVANSPILNVTGGQGYTLRVAGNADFNGNTIVNATSGNMLFENGINYAAGTGTTLDKRGGATVTLMGAANHTGKTIIQGGTLSLRGANGALSNTSGIELRGGQLLVENGDAANANRLPDGAPITLGGGTLRVAGTETAIGTVTAVSGGTTVAYSMDVQTGTPVPLTLTSFSREKGATLNFTSDFTTLGATDARGQVTSRIHLPGQSSVTGINILPWATANTNEFAQYNTSVDAGVIRGVTVLGNNGTSGYNNDPAEGTLTSSIIGRLTGQTATTTLTADRTIQAIKFDGGARGTNESGRRIDLAGFTLNVASGAIIHVNNVQAVANSSATTGKLTTGVAGTPTEFFFHVNGGTLEVGPTSTNGTNVGLTGQVEITDNAAVGGAVSLVKTGGGTLQLRNTTVANSFTGGIYVNGGTLEVWRGANLGASSSNSINLAAGTLNLNIPDATGTNNVNIAGLGHNVNVTGTSVISMDNNGETGGTGTDNNFNMGSLTVGGPYTLGIAGFDSQDLSFTSASFADTPTIDMFSRDAAHSTTINGGVSGSGFYVSGTGATAGSLILAGSTANTYSGPVTVNGGFLLLSKDAGVTAITADTNPATADLTINPNGNTNGVNLTADNQIDDNANIVVNSGFMGFGNRSEKIASLTVNGGRVFTGIGTNNGTVEITGDVQVLGVNDGIGLIADNGTTLKIGGTLTVADYGRVTVGAGAAGLTTMLEANNVNLTGTTILQNTGGNVNRFRLNGDVTTNAALIPARFDGLNDTDTFLELNGARTFNIADGAASEDFTVNNVIINSTAAEASIGGIIKNGPGLMAITGTQNVNNSFTGTTTVNEGTLDLDRTGTNRTAIPGPLVIGDGTGGAGADKVRLRGSNQIADTSAVTINDTGVLDLELTNASEIVGSLSGSGQVLLGAGSAFGVAGAANTEFSGSIKGSGSFSKGGTGVLEMSGQSEYVGVTSINSGSLVVTGGIAASPVEVNNTGTLGGNGSVGGVTVASGGIVTPGNGVGVLSTGDFSLAAGGKLTLDVAGLTYGTQYDSVNVSGGIMLGGDLELSVAGMLPLSTERTDLFFLMINDGLDSVSGQFAGLGEGAKINVSGYEFTLTYQANFEAAGGASFTGGNDIALSVPEPSTAVSLFGGLGALLGLRRFGRRRS